MFLNGVLLCILPLAVPLYAQPPLRHKLSNLVLSYNLLSNLKHEGFDKEKFDLTYCNLHSANETLKYYSDQNILKNTKCFSNNKKNTIVINFKFFKQPNEIVLRSLSSIISKTNRKYYPPRGKVMLKKIDEIRGNSFKKTTVGGCIVERVNNTTLIYPENTK